MDATRIFPDDYVPNAEAAAYHKKWTQGNPGEAARWVQFRDDVIAKRDVPPPAMATRYGKALVAAGKLHMSVTDIGSAPPTTIDRLPWEPPVLASGSGTVNWTMTNANRQNGALLSGAGRDLHIVSGEALTGPVIQLNGWRHVVWIGGSITDTGAGDRYALPISATGTVHLEGLSIRCDGDALMSRGGGVSCTWQVQNCRFEVHFNGGAAEHSDCFQTQGGSKINLLRFARCTMLTDYQGFFLRLATPDAFMNGGDFRQLNFRRRTGFGDPAQAWMFFPDEDPATGHGAGAIQIGDTAMTDVWVESTHSSSNSILYPSWLFESALANPALGNFGNLEGIFRETDGTGQYVRPSTTSDTVPAGGTASGQTCESAGWTGIIRMGVPPGDDYCPASVPGIAYVSPGYE